MGLWITSAVLDVIAPPFLGMEIEPIEGYRIRRALGAGSAGTAWLARDLASGRSVVLRRIPEMDVPAPQVFRRDLALARGLDHRHAVRLADIRQAGREWVLVGDFVAGGSLADLLDRRRPLGTGELVTLLVPVAQALAAAHRVGLTHDHLGPGDILLSTDGRPLVGDFGLRSIVPDQDRIDDLTALIHLARKAAADTATVPTAFFTGGFADIAARLLTLAPPQPIALTFGPTPTSPHRPRTRPPSQLTTPRPPPVRLRPTPPSPNRPTPPTPTRPTSAPPSRQPSSSRDRISSSRGQRAVGKHRPVPVDHRSLPPATPTSATSIGWQRLRILGIVAVVVSALGVTVGLGLNASRADESNDAPNTIAPQPTPSPPNASTTPTTPPTTPPATSPAGAATAIEVARWRTVLTNLDTTRARAFATPDIQLLDAVYQRGSVPWRSDRSLLTTYRTRATKVEGLHITIDTIDVIARTSTTVTLRVTDRLTSGTVITSNGERTTLPPGTKTTRLITLTTDGPRWRISRITSS